jgi:Tol biopolymer transport system component
MKAVNPPSLTAFFLRRIGSIVLACAALVLLATVAGGLSAHNQQVYFVTQQGGKAGMVRLDVRRGIFTRYHWASPIRSVADWSWSPDGALIAFKVTRGISVDLMAMDSNGIIQGWLTLDGRNNRTPNWSRDGQKIVFTSDRDGNAEIYRLDVACVRLPEGCGQQQRRLTDHPAVDEAPAWSPDGRQIAFQSRRDGDHEIYLMDADGGHLRRLTFDPGRDLHPAWSPDGSQIAFVSSRSGNNDIYLLDIETGDIRQLTATPEFEFYPRWSPDGTQILFEAIEPGSDMETYLMNADGTSRQRLTTVDLGLHNPVWAS